MADSHKGSVKKLHLSTIYRITTKERISLMGTKAFAVFLQDLRDGRAHAKQAVAEVEVFCASVGA
jgi:hypothetical protein